MANSPSSKVSFLELKSQEKKALGRQKLVEWGEVERQREM